jgi:subtilisin family serine protease
MRIEASDRTALVGLKAPDQPRGVWQGKILLNSAQWEEAKRVITSASGVALVSADAVLPLITVRLENASVMRRLRALSVVDYVEPARLPAELFQPIGCAQDLWGSLPTPFSLDEMRLPGLFPDVMPWNYKPHLIPEAWALGVAGDGVKVAVVDTGVFRQQNQFHQPTFSAPPSLGVGRLIWHSFTHGHDPWDACGHGTRMAGTVAAPHDGANIVGVAWKASLVTVKALPGVLVTAVNVGEVAEGIRQAVDAHGAKIVVMAFGDAFASARIADEIRLQYYSNDVLLIAAAGTYVCPGDFVAFPARMEEVVAVTGVTEGGGIHPSACAGREVDLAAVIGEAPAPGKTQDDVIHFGGSSNASAIVAGVAALVWSKHPDWNRDAVRDRLYRTTDRGHHDGRSGYGRVNAYRAIGGFWDLSITGPMQVSAGGRYQLSAVPEGGGPNFTYRWNNGATTAQIEAVAGEIGTSQPWTVEVTDVREGKTLARSRTVSAVDTACLRACRHVRDGCLNCRREPGECPLPHTCVQEYQECKRECGAPP